MVLCSVTWWAMVAAAAAHAWPGHRRWRLGGSSSSSEASTPSPSDQPSPGCDVGEVTFDIREGPVVQHLCDGLYVIGDGLFISVFVVSDRGVVLLDAPSRWGDDVHAELVASVTDTPITHLVYPLYTLSHAAGAGALLAAHPDLEIVASAETARQLELSPFLDVSRTPLPTRTYEEAMTLVVGNQTIELRQYEAVVFAGNSWAYLPHHQLLHAMDAATEGGFPPYLSIVTAMPMVRLVEDMLALPLQYATNGHYDRLMRVEDVQLRHQYLEELFASCVTALATVEPPTVEDVFDYLPLRLEGLTEHCVEEMVVARGWGTDPSKQPRGSTLPVENNCYGMCGYLFEVIM